MSVTIQKYEQLSKLLAAGDLDLDANTLKLALLASAYAFDQTDTLFATPGANEIAAGGGYTAGGTTLSGATLSSVAEVTSLDADDVVWPALTATFRGAVLYASGTLGGVVNPVLAYILFDDTPADVTVTGIDFSVLWNASGILTVG